MDAIKFVKEKMRMCKEYKYCIGCPILDEEHRSCLMRQEENPEEVVSIVARWAEKHPQKTILEDFLEKYPKAKMSGDGKEPYACVKSLYGLDSCPVSNCFECWNRPLSEVLND